MKKTILVSDPHGCYDTVKCLFKKISIADKDEVIILGDIADRGKRVADTAMFFIDLDAKFIMGNHDDRICAWKKGESVNIKPVHKASIDDIEASINKNKIWEYLFSGAEHYEFSINNRKYIAVHAGLLPDLGINTPRGTKLRLRRLDSFDNKKYKDMGMWFNYWNKDETVIFGHTVFNEIYFSNKIIGIDTGCCFGNKLSALILYEDGRTETVQMLSDFTYGKYSHNKIHHLV